MKTNTVVTFIIPTLNAEKYLEQCLESIAKQTHQSYEVHFYSGHYMTITFPYTQKNLHFLTNYLDIA